MTRSKTCPFLLAITALAAALVAAPALAADHPGRKAEPRTESKAAADAKDGPETVKIVAKTAAPADNLDALRERLAEKLGAARPADAKNAGLMRVTAKLDATPPAAAGHAVASSAAPRKPSATVLAAVDADMGRVRLDGPSGVKLRSSTVQTLTMALHELATNAVQYGALGQAGATLSVRWHVEAGQDQKLWLHIDWHESGVRMQPAADAGEGIGHGRELIERALPYQLEARTGFTLGPDGLRCTISMPVSELNTPR